MELSLILWNCCHIIPRVNPSCCVTQIHVSVPLSLLQKCHCSVDKTRIWYKSTVTIYYLLLKIIVLLKVCFGDDKVHICDTEIDVRVTKHPSIFLWLSLLWFCLLLEQHILLSCNHATMVNIFLILSFCVHVIKK